jgi:hypothetical protein
MAGGAGPNWSWRIAAHSQDVSLRAENRTRIGDPRPRKLFRLQGRLRGCRSLNLHFARWNTWLVVAPRPNSFRRVTNSQGSPREGLAFFLAVFRKFGRDGGLDQASTVPFESDDVHSRNAAMRVSWDIVGRANHKRVRTCVERVRGLTRLKVSIPADLLHRSKMAVGYREHLGGCSLGGTASRSGP